MTITRDPATGFVTGSTLGSTTETRTYNSYGEEQSYTVKFNTTVLYSVDYGTRDGLGRIVTKTETIQGETHTYVYGYDARNRLSDVSKDGVATSHYDYDANGNRLTAPNLAASPSYDAQDRLTSYGSCTYAYKPDGSLQTKTCPEGTTSYDYDAFGNLRHMTLPDGTAIDYLIDGQNRRIGKKVNGVMVEGFLYRNQLQPAAWLNGDGTVRARFIYGGKPNVPEYMVTSAGATYRIATDQVGSIRLVVDTSSGAVVERVDWDDFGNPLSDSAPGTQPFGFARLGARDYDAATGRWTNKDPLRFDARDVNLYLYTANDVINKIDPSGRDAAEWFYQNAPEWLLNTDFVPAANVAAGFGDTITSFGIGQYFGISLTDLIRKASGTNDVINKCSWAYSGGVIAGELWLAAMATNENIGTNMFRKSEIRSKYFRWGEGPFKYDGVTRGRPHFHVWPDMEPHLPWQWQWWLSKW